MPFSFDLYVFILPRIRFAQECFILNRKMVIQFKVRKFGYCLEVRVLKNPLFQIHNKIYSVKKKKTIQTMYFRKNFVFRQLSLSSTGVAHQSILTEPTIKS